MMTIHTNLAALNAQRHLRQNSRNLEAALRSANENLRGSAADREVTDLSTRLARGKVLTTASTLVLRKANDLQASRIDLFA
jgi:flagellin-like hook-associated protein FlgL